MIKLSLALALMLQFDGACTAQPLCPEAKHLNTEASSATHDPAEIKSWAAVIAPSGRLRVGVNLGNTVLIQRDVSTGCLQGASVTMADELGRDLGVPVVLLPYRSAAAIVADASKKIWDIAFLARDPSRVTLAFTVAYTSLEGTYLVQAGSPAQAVSDLDQDGMTIASEHGTAYDLYLSRTLKHAKLVPVASTEASIELVRSGGVSAAAGVRQLLQKATATADLRLISPGFIELQQAIAVPSDHNASLPFLEAFLNRIRTSGSVDAMLNASNSAKP